MAQSARSLSAKALHSLPVSPRPKSAGASARLSLRLPSSVSSKDVSALSIPREGRWQPGLADQALHSEVFADACNASGAGSALALMRDFLRSARVSDDPLIGAEDNRQILWVQETRAIQRSGRPFLHGLPAEWQRRVIHAEAETAQDVLFAIEEGLKCRDLACVMGEIVGNPRGLDFTASRRLSLTAQRHRMPLWLVRLDAEADLSSARMRWRVGSAPSQASHWNSQAPGPPAWQAELFRARAHAPGKWILKDEQVHTRGTRLTARCANARATEPDCAAPHSRYMVRATVGRSLAAFARM